MTDLDNTDSPIRRKTRRGFLTLTAIAATGLSGCNSSSDDPNSNSDGSEEKTETTTPSDNSSSAPEIEKFTLSGDTLQVHVTNPGSFDTLRVLDENGSTFADQSATPGVEKIGIDLTGYRPGEHRFIAIRDEPSGSTAVEEATYTLEPDLTLSRVDAYRNVSEETISEHFEDKIGLPWSLIVWVENQGTGPARLVDIEATGLPSEPSNREFGKTIGTIRLQPGQQEVIATPGGVLEGDRINSYPTEDEFEITVYEKAGYTVSQTRPISYTLADDAEQDSRAYLTIDDSITIGEPASES